MNATFSIHRLGLTIYKELQEKYMIILTTIGIILMTYLAIWALNLIDGEPVTAAARAASAATILSIIGCLAPFFLYKNENRRMEGDQHAGHLLGHLSPALHSPADEPRFPAHPHAV